MEKTLDKIVALSKSRGFVYPGSEIYGGLANTWDYGNLGVELKNNVKRAWWQKFIMENPYNVGVDCAILMNPQTWVASGHLGGFSDPLMDCKECHERFRADKLIEDYAGENGIAAYGVLMYVSMIFQAVFLGYSVGTAPVIGYHYGAHNIDELKGLLKKSSVLIGLFSVCMFGAGELLSRLLAVLFVGYDKMLLDMTVHAFAIFSFSFLSVDVMPCIIRAKGQT